MVIQNNNTISKQQTPFFFVYQSKLAALRMRAFELRQDTRQPS